MTIQCKQALAAAFGLFALLGAKQGLCADNPSTWEQHTALSAVAGAPPRNAYVLSAQGGWPFSTLRVQAGLTERWSVVSELESVLLVRNRPMAGVGLRWYESKRLRIRGEALLGGLFQRTEEKRVGPNLEMRIRFAMPRGRFVPYALLGMRYVLLPDRTTIERASGESQHFSFRNEWTPWATFGLGFGITRAVGLDIGIDAGWVDAPTSIAIPGIHVGLHYGGGH